MKMEILPLAHEPYENLCSGGPWTLNFKDWRSERMSLAQIGSPVFFTDKYNNTATAANIAKLHLATNTETMTSNILPPYLQQSDTTNKMKNSITKKSNKRTTDANNHSNNNNNNSNNNNNNNSSSNNKSSRASTSSNSSINSIGSTTSTSSSNSSLINSTAGAASSHNHNNNNNNMNNNNNLLYCDDIDAVAVNELSVRLLDELRAAKSRHLTCTEVSLPCDLTPRIAAEIIRVSEKEPCGIRGCTIYIEFEDEPNNSRRIASLKLDPETVSTFEVYLTLRQDHRGWASLLPQFMKSLARTITISPEFTITKHKLYSPERNSSYSYGSGTISRSGSSSSGCGKSRHSTMTTAISTPTASTASLS